MCSNSRKYAGAAGYASARGTYLFSSMVNMLGQRFVEDEIDGIDVNEYTIAVFKNPAYSHVK
jgi:hypothetical protein